MATLEGADPTFAQRVNALIAASGGRVYLKSGVRTTARQSQLWAAALRKYGSAAAARKWVAPPGRSNHEKGRAADLGGDLNLADRLAPQFGLHRPLPNEPWHFEPVGSRSGKQATQPVAGGGAPAAAATTAAQPAVSEPGADRRNWDVQIATLADILTNPIDWDEEVPV